MGKCGNGIRQVMSPTIHLPGGERSQTEVLRDASPAVCMTWSSTTRRLPSVTALRKLRDDARRSPAGRMGGVGRAVLGRQVGRALA